MYITDIVPGLAAGVGVRLSPNGKTAYYVEWSIGRLSKVEVATGMVTTVMNGLDLPEDVLVDWTSGDIFISQRTGDIIQTTGGKRPHTVAQPGGAPHQLALVSTATHRYLFTVCYDSGRLLRMDLNAGGAVHQVCAGLGHPVGLAIDAAHKFAYVTEQDTGALTRVHISNGAKHTLYTGLIAPFYLAWDKTGNGLYCVQRDPANSLVRLGLGPPVALTTVQTGLAWRPSGVAPNHNDTLIYICTDQKLEVLSTRPLPPIKGARPPFEIESIQFHQRQQGIGLKHTSGAAVVLPEYQRGVQNEPACFLAGSLPRIRVVLRKLGAFTPGTYTIGAVGSLGGVKYRDVTPTFNASGLSNPIDFELMWPLPTWVDRADVSLNWYARKTPGPAKTAAIGSAVHRLYVILATPTEPWVTETPWIGALDLACSWASGAADVDAAAGLVAQRYNASGAVSYDTVSGATMYGFSTFSLSQMLDRLNGGLGLGGKVNCTDSADTVSSLSNVLGCDLWQSRMESGATFALNEVIAIGYNVWAVPFGFGFSYHEVPWKGGCTQNDNIFDGCLMVDGDVDPTTAPHTPLLPLNMLFGDCAAVNYRLRLCTPNPDGCPRCQAQPATRQRRPIA